ncbi:sulfite exporter TauE/SafE family protein [Paenibacillus aurantiacus]|uniref:Probable membrane transporter protein n=1 Tax=Paenibacillus aurantiacus TaxID=1936118 RepID=A0ABV5KMM0_9BACL
MEETWIWFVTTFLITTAAGIAQGLTGFGFALIAMPILGTTLGMRSAVVVVVILSLLTNFAVLAPIRRHVHLGGMWMLILSSFAAAPLGAWLLAAAPAAALKLAAGVLVSVFALIQLRGASFPISGTRLSYPLTGALSGMLNGSISLSGPPVALFLSASGMDKMRFRANLTFFALALNIVTIAMYFGQDLLTTDVLRGCLAGIPGMVVGVALGISLAGKVAESAFRRLVLLFLTCSGLWTLISGLLSF